MKRLFSVCLLLVHGIVMAQNARVTRELPLDNQMLYQIPVPSPQGPQGVTTFTFPSPISYIASANVTTDPNIPAPFLLAHQPGTSFFSARALTTNVIAHLNIVYQSKTYVIRLIASSVPVFSVTFYQNSSDTPAQFRTDPTRLLGLLDKAKAFHLLRQSHPELLAEVDYDMPFTTNRYTDFNAVLEQVLRFDSDDTLIFRVRLDNFSTNLLTYSPANIAVKIGSTLYYQSVVDASSKVQPKASTILYFAITGNPTGGRNYLSVSNQFTILIPRASIAPKASS